MKNLENFLDNLMDKDVDEVLIYNTDGSRLKDPDYDEYLVSSHKYEQRDDGKYCIVVVEYDITP